MWFGVSNTGLRSNNSLEGLTGLKEATLHTVMVYFRKQSGSWSEQRKDTGVESRGDQEPARRALSQGSCGLQAMTCDDRPAVLPAGGAHEHGGAGVWWGQSWACLSIVSSPCRAPAALGSHHHHIEAESPCCGPKAPRLSKTVLFIRQGLRMDLLLCRWEHPSHAASTELVIKPEETCRNVFTEGHT